MPSVVADTHALVWHLSDPRRLGRGARRAFAAADAARWTCFVPTISLIEIWLLYERGRMRIGPAHVLEVLAGHSGYAVLPLDVEQAVEFGTLSALKDPMDRMIVSAARATGSQLVSADSALGDYGIRRIWD